MPSPSRFGRWLEGVRVLDFTAVLAGPHLTRILATAGADVIKIEPPDAGDSTRGLPYVYGEGRSGYFDQQNVAKRSVALSLATEEGRAIARALAKVSHCVVENYRPGVAAALGVDYASLSAVHPDIVYVSVSGWGQTGPRSKATGEVVSTTARSGMIGPDPAGEIPRQERCSFADTNAAVHGATAAALALRRQQLGLGGCYIDLSLFEALISTNDLEFPESLMAGAGGSRGDERRATGDEARVASGNFASNDSGWAYVRAIRPDQWCALVELLELPAAYAELSPVARRPHAAEVYAALEAFVANTSRDEAIAILRSRGISAAPVRTLQEVLERGEVWRAGLIQPLDTPGVGPLDIPTGLFAQLRGDDEQLRSAPLLGQHTRAVLNGVLGMDNDAVRRLAEAGVVGLAPEEIEARSAAP